MRLIKKAWQDISHGENLDLYATIIISIIVSFLGLLGYAPQNLVSSLNLTCLGILLAFSIKGDRNIAKTWEMQRLSKNLERIEQLNADFLRKSALSESIINSGLEEIHYQSRNINWDSFFKDVKEIDLFFLYARSWRSVHENLLYRFVRKSGNRMRVFLPDPSNEVILKELSTRFPREPDAFKFLINEAIMYFENLAFEAEQNGAAVEIWIISATPMYAFYRFDEKVVLSLNSYKVTKGNVPHFVACQGGEMYNYIIEEINSIIHRTGVRQMAKRRGS